MSGAPMPGLTGNIHGQPAFFLLCYIVWSHRRDRHLGGVVYTC